MDLNEHELPSLSPLERKMLLRAIRRTKREAIKGGSAFAVIMITAHGNAVMYSESSHFKKVTERSAA